MTINYRFVNYGEPLEPTPGTLVLDVGMTTTPGVIDHHHPQAEAECTASLIAKHPRLVLDHLGAVRPPQGPAFPSELLTIVTHTLPDFDAVASVFLALRLLEMGGVDAAMAKIAAYTKLVDSASLPKTIDLAGTPYAIFRALFFGSKKSGEDASRERIEEGLRFMRFLYARADEGYDFADDRRLYSGIDRYERSRRKVEDDYFQYLTDLGRGRVISLALPSIGAAAETKAVDGLVVRNPRSFLLREWARRDQDASPLGKGFAFLMTNFGNTRFILGVDPERGVNLRGLGALLNRRESEKRRDPTGVSGRAWYEGDCPFFNYRIIDSPQDGTSLSHEDVLETVLAFGAPGLNLQF